MFKAVIAESDDFLYTILEGILKGTPDLLIKKITNSIDVIHDMDTDDVDVVVINHNFQDSHTFAVSAYLKQCNPDAYIFVITSPGKASKEITAWSEKTNNIDEIIEKPVNIPNFKKRLKQVISSLSRVTTVSSFDSLKVHLPRNITETDLVNAKSGDMLLTEKTILFLDIRDSTKIISSQDIKKYSKNLNDLFAIMGKIIHLHDGEVIKYTGDGLLAIFGGFARAHLATNAASMLIRNEYTQKNIFKLGIGLADGLIMAGFIGPADNLFYDVLGENVNIAARLCSEAGENEVVMTKDVSKSCRLKIINSQSLSLKVKGINVEIETIKYLPLLEEGVATNDYINKAI